MEALPVNQSPGDWAGVRRALRAVRTRARGVLVARAVFNLVASLIGAAVVLVLADFLLRLPREIRLFHLFVALGWVVHWTRRAIIPGARFRPSLTEIALRVEQTPGAPPDLAGHVASGLELSELAGGEGVQAALAREASREGAARFEASAPRAREVIASRVAWVAGARAAAIALLIALLAILAPAHARAGSGRLLTPWAGIHWPRATEVTDLTLRGVQPLGSKVELRAVLTRTDRAPGRTPLFARATLRLPGLDPQTLRIRLVSQERVTDEGGVRGELFLGDVPTLAPAEVLEGELVYHFETPDGPTEARRVALVAPPTLERAVARVVLPPYAAEQAPDTLASGERDLGDGSDERAVVGPVLRGSRVDIELTFNKPVTEGDEAWSRTFAEACAPGAGLDVTFDGASARLTGQVERSFSLTPRPRDAEGMTLGAEAVFHVDVVDDQGPAASIVEPARDERVLARALIDLRAEARDDVAVERLWIEAGQASAPTSSASREVDPPHAWREIEALAGLDPGTQRAAQTRRAASRLDLGAWPGLAPGDEVWITCLAADGLTGREAVRSTPRRLVIIDEQEFAEQARAELSALSQNARRLDERQANLTTERRRSGRTDAQTQGQASISDQIRAQTRNLDGLAQRLERNRADDPLLRELIEDVAGALEVAREASARAERELRENPEPRDQGEARLDEAQDQVRSALGEIARMLDQGRDNWLARRDLERLIESQRALADQTRAMARATAGRSMGQLSPEERSALERIAQAQREASEQAASLLDDLSERARELDKADPAQAQAMREASARGRQAEVSRRMEQAAQGLTQNQTGPAQQAQQQALESLEQMRDDLDDAPARRDEMLRRALASILESLETLIARQRRELNDLLAARASGALEGLDADLITLRTQTLGVLDQAAQGGSDLQSVARLIEQASSAQEEAIKALRLRPVNDLRAEETEALALQRLEQAREEAGRLEEAARQRDQDRKRAELRQAYRDLLEQQVSLRGDTEPFEGKDLSRRDRQSVRLLGERQESIRAQAAAVRDATQELDEAPMFRFAHERLEEETRRAAELLTRAEGLPEALRRESASVRILQSLVEAMADDGNQQSDFRDQQAGQQGGDQGQSQPQPLFQNMAQLKLLRSMQAEALERTRALDDAGGGTPEEISDVVRLQQELSRLGQKLLEDLSRPQGSEPLQSEGP